MQLVTEPGPGCVHRYSRAQTTLSQINKYVNGDLEVAIYRQGRLLRVWNFSFFEERRKT